MAKTLGIDMGTSSIGLSVRSTENGKSIQDQLEYFTSIIFNSGVGRGKTGEFSYAAKRTKYRSGRRLYQARKYRIWETLKVLIDFDFCPLSLKDLERWSRYDKAKGLKRKYPVDAYKFEEWVRLDFDGDGVVDYTSPYQLRAELMEKQFDFTNQTERFKLGRAIYHIAQRRGFKSSKGETIKEQEKIAEEKNIERDVEIDLSAELKKSEEKKSKDLVAYMKSNGLKTVGCAFAKLENEGIRVRASEYQAVRSQYKDEITEIFNFQDGLDIDGDFFKRIISERKGEGSVFYKRPLRSQKGLVGECTLEPTKPRCPIGHFEFEEFRAWNIINNIKYRRQRSDNWIDLSIEQKQQLFSDKFLRTTVSFKFEEITRWLEKQIGYRLSYKDKTINYKENVSVSGCPICGRFKKIFGDNWKDFSHVSSENRINKKTGDIHRIQYDIDDIWHLCFSSDEAEYVEEFAKLKLHFDSEKSKELVRLWGAMPQGYSMLSLKAIKNINRFLKKGFIYTDAVLLAKLPEILGEELWAENEENIIKSIQDLSHKNRETKRILNIVNSLIANYKALGFNEDLNVNEKFAENDTEYKLDTNDFKEIEKAAQENFGIKAWQSIPEVERKDILDKIARHYQGFFASIKRDYIKLPKLGDTIKDYLSDNFDFLRCANKFTDKDHDKTACSCSACKKLNKIYHPSMIEFYKPAKEVNIEYNNLILSKRLLESPVIGAFKNPMAMRAMHILRKQVNELLISGFIDEDTRIVVETARDLNDANMRWAIEAYQREREKENKEFEAAIKEHFPTRIISDDDIDKARLLIDQQDIPETLIEQNEETDDKKKKKRIEKAEVYKKDVTKYRLWLEQGCRCIYTGKVINITTLFDDNKVDFEHTIPRSISFDNSLANLTVCDVHFNRTVKKNQIPAQLPEYDSILLRIRPWIEKVAKLKDNVEVWSGKSKSAQDNDYKDYAIRQRHLWQMELNYWRDKVDRFTMLEVTTGFKNSQLVDTRLITKYAYHYLKSVFSKVEVQKGIITADFRKMLGVPKSRDNHSHHAIDASVLTLIPSSAKRDKMLALFYKIKEDKKLNKNISDLKNDLEKEIRSCGIGRDVSTIVQFIEENILINHVSKDQTLVPAGKKARKRGKEIFTKNSSGDLVNKWITGDSIRGQLHGETFYGAITQAIKDENGRFLKNEDGSVKIGEQVYYVVRKELKHRQNSNDSGFYNWEDLKKLIVNKSLVEMMKKQFEPGISFKDACERGIYMLDKKDNKVNRIRHIRCYAPQIKNPLAIKKHTYLSDKAYKQNYYAEMGDLYIMCKYMSQDVKHKEFIIYSLYDISQNRQNGIEDIPLVVSNSQGQKLALKQSIKVGDLILIFKNNKEELVDMDRGQLSDRLYVVRGFETSGKRIILKKHINAKPDAKLGKGESIKDFSQMPDKIRCGVNTIKFLQKDIDFEVNTNGIDFK